MSVKTNIVNNCDAISDLIPEYAFGLTDPADTRLVEANLADCPDAAAQLEDFRHLQDEMRSNVPQVEPPPELGARLMAALAAAPAVAAPATPAPNTDSVPAAAPAAVKPRRVPRIAWLVAAAAVLALVVTNIYWLTRVADLTQTHDLLTALRAVQDSPFVLTSTDALHWVRLANPDENGTAAFMMWNSDSKTGLLYARGFPELEPGYKYHVWLTRPNERVFMGILQVDEDGDGALLFNSPEPINDFSWAWVTAENGTDNVPPTQIPAVVKGELNPA